jgi:hypothetical protein
VQGKVDVCNLFWWEIEQCMNDDGKNLGCGEIGEDAESDGMGPGMGLGFGCGAVVGLDAQSILSPLLILADRVLEHSSRC